MASRTLLPYQARWVSDQSGLKVIEKSRRIGLSWCEAYDSVMHAGAGDGSVYYQSYALDMTRGFISDCVEWAEALQVGAEAVGETLIELGEGGAAAPAFRLPLASGKEIVAMTSAPRAFRSRGRPGDRAIVDEAAFVDDLSEVLKAAMAFRIWGGTVRVLSTHNGEASAFCQLVADLREKRRPGSLHTVTFAAAVREGLGRRRFAATGRDWSPAAEAAWVLETRAEYGAAAAEELDCVPSTGVGWLSWAEIRAAEEPEAGDPERFAGGRTVIGWDVARRRHLSVLWVLEMVGGVAWTREVVELQGQSFAAQDAELDRLVDRYGASRIAIDQTGMGEKLVEDAQRRHGRHRVEGVLMTGPARLEVATSLKRRVEDHALRIPASDAIRRDLRAVKRVAGPTGTPRLVADESGTDGHADRFWALALACATAETTAPRYELHRIDNHKRLDHRRPLGRPGALRMRGQPGGL